MKIWMVAAAALGFLAPAPLLAQQGNCNGAGIQNVPPRGVLPSDVMAKFATREAMLLQARKHYDYRESLKIEELDLGNNVTGKFEEVSDLGHDPNGQRNSKFVYFPVATLRDIPLRDPQEIDRHAEIVLTPANLSMHDVRYLGTQRIDEIGTYVFDVSPRQCTGDYCFKGRVWVDDRDSMVIKTCGRNIPHGKDKTGLSELDFETYREQIDGKFWFATYVHAHGKRLRVTVKYQNYKQHR